MLLKLDGEPGFVIHTRPYKENSFLVELYTLNFGRISASVHLSKKVGSRSKGIFRPFVPLKLSLHQTSGNLWSLTDAFMQRVAYKIPIPQIFSATYLNELIYNLVKTNESSPKLFAAYIKSLQALENPNQEFFALREFESVLIDTLGYGISYNLADGTAIDPNLYYFFNPQNGFELEIEPDEFSYKGSDLLDVKQYNFINTNAKKILKNLNKTIIDFLLDGKKLKSRELYSQYLMV